MRVRDEDVFTGVECGTGGAYLANGGAQSSAAATPSRETASAVKPKVPEESPATGQPPAAGVSSDCSRNGQPDLGIVERPLLMRQEEFQRTLAANLTYWKPDEDFDYSFHVGLPVRFDVGITDHVQVSASGYASVKGPSGEFSEPTLHVAVGADEPRLSWAVEFSYVLPDSFYDERHSWNLMALGKLRVSPQLALLASLQYGDHDMGGTFVSASGDDDYSSGWHYYDAELEYAQGIGRVGFLWAFADPFYTAFMLGFLKQGWKEDPESGVYPCMEYDYMCQSPAALMQYFVEVGYVSGKQIDLWLRWGSPGIVADGEDEDEIDPSLHSLEFGITTRY